MHSGHILRRWNEDILAEIFGHLQAEIIDAPTASSTTRRTLDPQSTSGSRNGTSEGHHGEYDLALIALARCARASRVLHEPAINALWNTVHSISHLTGVLACASKYRDQQDANTHILVSTARTQWRCMSWATILLSERATLSGARRGNLSRCV